MKFDGEYDFDEWNAKFDKKDIADEFKKMTLKSDGSEVAVVESVSDKALNGDKDTASIDEGEIVDDEDEPVSGEIFYDKTKSFFDNISCEASDRSKGITNRPNWREERRLNTETFGTSGYRRYRGGRGRGGPPFRGGRSGGGPPRGRGGGYGNGYNRNSDYYSGGRGYYAGRSRGGRRADGDDMMQRT